MYFSPHLILRNSEGQNISLSAPKVWGPDVYIVPRAQCSFRRISLNGKGRNALLAAKWKASNEALPQENELQLVADTEGLGAGIWTYGTGYIDDVDKENLRGLPESLIYTVMEQGVRLVQCFEGVEGQIWANSSLIASRWWSTEPQERQWQTFLRAASVDGQEIERPGKPAAIKLPYRKNIPLFDMDIKRAQVVFSPVKLAVGSVLVLGCVFTYFGAQYVRYVSGLASIENKIAKISEEVELVLSQRQRALVNVNVARRFDVIGDPAMILSGLDSLSRALSEHELVLVGVTVADHEFTAYVKGDISVNGPEFVRRLESMPELSDVSVTEGGAGTLTLTAQLTGQYSVTEVAETVVPAEKIKP